MARQKTNKTAKKRLKLSNPRGNKKAKLIYKQSQQGHLKTKKSRRAKRRQSSNIVLSAANDRNMRRKVVNL